MAVNTIKVELEVPKELKEIIDVVDLLTGHFMEKKDLTALAAYIPQVMVAVDGYDKLGEEIKSQFRDEGAAYLVHKIMARLLPVDISTETTAP